MRRISFKSGGTYNHRRNRRLSLLQLTVEVDEQEYDSLDWVWAAFVLPAFYRTASSKAA